MVSTSVRKATNETYVGLFLVTLATLFYELLLTRIFSVTMWYHFAFMAVSLAMFGLTVGGLLVYLRPNYFTPARAHFHLAMSSLLFGMLALVTFFIHTRLPFHTPTSLRGLLPIAVSYGVISVPFVFSGICVSLALTRFPAQLSKLYAADLAGAAAGCIVLIYTLQITDGPTAVLVVALLASLGATFFARQTGSRGLFKSAVIFSLAFAALTVANTILVWKQRPLVRLERVKERTELEPLYEKWNSFSRITVTGDPDGDEEPFGWGLSPTYPTGRRVRQLYLRIDARALTPLTAFDGNFDQLDYLRYDVTNFVHYIRPESRVFIAGAGGGRDILSALVFGQKSVLAVEINEDIIDTVNGRFGDFTGHLDRIPRVTFVNDEARSYIARHQQRFDIIQASLIDTWAATAAGAFVLTENSLYTVEAWKLFLERTTRRGVLSFSRWYHLDIPIELYRLTSLAAASLTQVGVAHPRKHIVIVRHFHGAVGVAGIGTLLVSKAPFTAKDLETIEDVSRKLRFQVVLSPRFSLDTTFSTLASGKGLDQFTATFPFNIAPPTDDSPFFFQMSRLGDLASLKLWQLEPARHLTSGMLILGILLITVLVLTCLAIFVPLWLLRGQAPLRNAVPLLLFFSAIGFGYMLVEISQLQRLTVYLGHPTYSLSVVLFTLLLSSGVGSFLTGKLHDPDLEKSGQRRLLLLLCTLMLFGLLTPQFIRLFHDSVTPVRILVATAILCPIGLFMGMAFPLGMKAASKGYAELTPWLWGINGATSVCASVLAVAIALQFGISKAYWSGFAWYAVAFLAFACIGRTSRHR